MLYTEKQLVQTCVKTLKYLSLYSYFERPSERSFNVARGIYH
jgi:hypothetical protein